MACFHHSRVRLLICVFCASYLRHVFQVIKLAAASDASLELSKFILELLDHIMPLVHTVLLIYLLICSESQLILVHFFGAFFTEFAASCGIEGGLGAGVTPVIDFLRIINYHWCQTIYMYEEEELKEHGLVSRT